MTTRIGIMGAGALGSYVGAFLARAGEDVTMVDMWPEHVETMKRDGLRASGSQGDFTVPIKALHLTEAQNIVDQFDFAFISLKSYDTEWATHFIKRYVKPDGCFVSLQNCWNDPTSAASSARSARWAASPRTSRSRCGSPATCSAEAPSAETPATSSSA